MEIDYFDASLCARSWVFRRWDLPYHIIVTVVLLYLPHSTTSIAVQSTQIKGRLEYLSSVEVGGATLLVQRTNETRPTYSRTYITNPTLNTIRQRSPFKKQKKNERALIREILFSAICLPTFLPTPIKFHTPPTPKTHSPYHLTKQTPIQSNSVSNHTLPIPYSPSPPTSAYNSQTLPQYANQ